MENIEKYLNTMMFIIIAKGLTVGLLVLLLLDIGQQFSYVVITYQFGLLFVAIWAIYLITAYDKNAAKLKAAAEKSTAYLDTCPDFFVRTYDEQDNIICKNTFTTADDRYTYTVFTDDQGISVNVSNLLQTSKTMDGLCDKVDNYSSYPWTEYKAKCDKL